MQGSETRALVAGLAQGALGLWIFSFVFALISSVIASGVFGVPLYQVVDADFSVVLFFLALGCAFIFLALVMNFATGNFAGVFACLFFIALYAGQSLAGAAAYLLYAAVDHVSLAGTSFVYVGYSHVVVLAAKVVGATIVAGVVASGTVNWWQTMQGVATIGGCVSFVTTLVTFFFGRSLAEA